MQCAPCGSEHRIENLPLPTTKYIGVYQAGSSSSRPSPDVKPDKSTTLHETGFDSAESCLAIAADGTLFFAPAFSDRGAAVVRSRDEAKSWQLCPVERPNRKHHGRPQPYLHLEPETQRLSFYTAAFGVLPPSRGFHLSWSDDQGDTWRHRTIARDTVDWGKMYGGPSAKKGDAARALYFSAPAPISTRFFPVLFPKYQRIYRSYDNGETWSDCSRISLKPRQHGLDRREWVIFGSGVVAADGTVFLGFRRGPRLGIATSHDDAETWQIHDIPGADLLGYHNIFQVGLVNPNYVIGEPLAMGDRDNLYALWPDVSDRLRLAWSPDKGVTWSQSVVVSAPRVKRIRYSAMATGPHGALAIAYYGTEDGHTYHGYLAETLDPTAASPVFTGGPVNDVGRPLYPRGWDTGYIDMFAGGDLNEIVQVRYAPSGAIYASFCRQERPGWPRRLRPRARLVGVVGELR
jgi:hypothetical protein